MKITTWLPLVLLLSACDDVEESSTEDDFDHGVITRVALTFQPQAGGDPVIAEWADPENDGSPVIDDITLSDTDDYDLEIEVWNDLVDPVEDVTEEITSDAETHQFFFTGSAIAGSDVGDAATPMLAHTYEDEDENGLPLGLQNTVSTLDVGEETLTVTLRHLPPEDGTAVKVEGLDETVATNGFSAIGGETDAEVSFTVTVE